ncbi:hypothetical protein D9V77_00580 [Buchnera aphidicola (Sitobion avenae)]|uniref:Uncharacterized protein n=1 Tax=Buchnera aphidicola (Sitobion avenae) TaxID=571428 RepID=A0A4D6YAP6_9GAMM|nr:Rnf-Nqr domain containing protein [Buchnera aphidicola]QCI25343.1 hypothetical protein D9V77_00580 [Buchnera aphidicola (Sitobion avenae)]
MLLLVRCVIGATTTVVLTIISTMMSIVKNFIIKDLRILIYMIIIFSVVTSIEILFYAYWLNLYQSSDVFIPLIVTNYIIIG